MVVGSCLVVAQPIQTPLSARTQNNNIVVIIAPRAFQMRHKFVRVIQISQQQETPHTVTTTHALTEPW